MVAHHFDNTVVIEPENHTTYIQTGDVIYTHYAAGWRHGNPDALSEVYWAYDRYARPTIPGVGTPSTANVFGRFIGDPTPFYEVCSQMLVEGAKQIEIRRANASAGEEASAGAPRPPARHRRGRSAREVGWRRLVTAAGSAFGAALGPAADHWEGWSAGPGPKSGPSMPARPTRRRPHAPPRSGSVPRSARLLGRVEPRARLLPVPPVMAGPHRGRQVAGARRPLRLTLVAGSHCCADRSPPPQPTPTGTGAPSARRTAPTTTSISSS